MGPKDVDRLRDHGLDDEQITVAAQVISYFNYINRIAEGLGVDDELWMNMPRDQWHACRAHDWQFPAAT
jgi:uncharacterized protein YciW